MAKAQHDRIRPRLRKGDKAKSRPPSGTLLRRMQGLVGRRMDTGRRGWRGAYVPSPGRSAQRVIVKVQIVKPRMSGHTSWKVALHHHLEYVQREGVELGGEAWQIYTQHATGVDTTGFLGRSTEDPHQFRIIVSAEHGADLDLTSFTRAFMGHVEDDLGTRLDWVAVNHYDTDHPHTHVLLRGTDGEGQPLAMQPDYITQGLRYRAQDVATRELGPRMEREAGMVRTPQLNRDRGIDLDF